MDLVYLDNNATTRPADAVVDAMTDLLREAWGNPSSVHRFGQEARRRVDLARARGGVHLACGSAHRPASETVKDP